MRLVDYLKEQKDIRLPGSLYEQTQIYMAYNSNRIEGSTLSLEQTSFLYTDNLVSTQSNNKLNDYIETNNHFTLFDHMLDTAEEPLSHDLLKKYHYLLKNGTDDSKKDWFNVGEYKSIPNIVGFHETTPPEKVVEEMDGLFRIYESSNKNLEDIVRFHVFLELIHPFQDGNGRVGRIILFKECLNNDIIPPIVQDSQKQSYYNGIQTYMDHPSKLHGLMQKYQRQYKKMIDYYSKDIYFKSNIQNSKKVK